MKKLVCLFIISFIAIQTPLVAQLKNGVTIPGPIDPQMVQDQDQMTWDDYNPVPGINWADPSLKPKREFRMALVAVDFSDQPFVITLPEKSDPFGNPQCAPIRREDVPQFYSDFWLKPSPINHGQTINGYWMEQSRGRFGITALDHYGPYRMPKPLWKYGLSEWGQNEATPTGEHADYWMEADIDSLWQSAEGDIAGRYDAVLRIYAGYDETGIWQEFGEMKFNSKEDIPAEWGNTNPDKPRWITTRYVPWTSWKAGQMQWGLSSIRQGENSGTITHELGHYAFDIGDNNNNPYKTPYRRVGSGPWDMMDRGCFNGPGGPHMRWVVPPVAGASMPAGLMLRNRMINGFIDDSEVLTISRDALESSAAVFARITARAVTPLKGEFAGLIVRLDGAEPHDRTPETDPAKDPLSPGQSRFDFYSVEVVQRIGYDSFCPDNGVLLAKNTDMEGKNGGPNEFNCFNWVIDAHPEDINMVDYIKPDGEKVMRTIADYRQLNDALFHAGLDSGSEFEYVDTFNRLHFYVIDIHRNTDGILSYTVGVRSLDSKISSASPVLESPPGFRLREGAGKTVFNLKGEDIYRMKVNMEGDGWSAKLLNELAASPDGSEITIPVYITKKPHASKKAVLRLSVTSESNPEKCSVAAVNVKR